MTIPQFLKRQFDIDFPTQEQLENLRYYKYAAVDKSYVTKYILSHYWNWAITLFPMWIAYVYMLYGTIYLLLGKE